MKTGTALDSEVEAIGLTPEIEICSEDPSSRLDEGNRPPGLQEVISEHQCASAGESMLWVVFEKGRSFDQEIEVALVPGSLRKRIRETNAPARNKRRKADVPQIAIVGSEDADAETVPAGDRPSCFP